MRYRVTGSRGITMIELMIVVAIIGILVALAIPRFMHSSSKARQSEAKSILKQIYVNQRTYFQQSLNNSYCFPGAPASATNPNSFSEIWIEIMPSARYTYTIAGGGGNFTATAEGNIDDDPTLDTWTIDDQGNLINTVNDITA